LCDKHCKVPPDPLKLLKKWLICVERGAGLGVRCSQKRWHKMSMYFFVFAVTLLVGVALVLTKRWHGHFSMDGTVGVQKLHTKPTPRIGGVAIAFGLIIGWTLAAEEVRAIISPMLLASLPAFAFGLAEDITKKVGVLPRLLATMFSGLLAWCFTGVSMQDTGLPPLDWLLYFTPVAVLFTAFAVGGVANAINIIDGFNGLAAGAVAIMLAAMGLIAMKVDDMPLAIVCFITVVCALGFGAVNWPFGKIFLGDGGAYLLGFVLAWVAILLPMRHTEINAWATILVCAYPVLEVGFSVWRRRHRAGHHPGQPDKVHLHHLIHRRIVCQLLPGLSPELKNGLTSPLCWSLVLAPAAFAVVFAKDTPMLVLAFGVSLFCYAAVYARLSQFHWCLSPRTRVPKFTNTVT
jgi:UDP-N-acetylmuramyl pentapeptide phosphotransferase/UDP-N-acetylglucosamine-1-phosphate transferase